MSHIDSYDHEFLGKFAYLPVYHPLQEVDRYEWGEEDFGFTPANLILGGGSGEHPGLVIHKLECCVARFLIGFLSEKDFNTLTKEGQEYLRSLASTPTTALLEYCGWTKEHHQRFETAVHSEAVNGPVAGEDLQDWLAANVGEFVYFSLPELNPEQARMKALMRPFQLYGRYVNFLCVPPGYPPEGGRKVVDNQVVWGNHRWFG